MKITLANFTLYDGNKTLRATADVTLGKTITIHKVKIVEGQRGLFVAMPTRKENEKYVPNCTILDANVQKEITAAMLQQYAYSGRHGSVAEEPQDDM